MSQQSKDFEWSRERLKREQKNPNIYTKNRQEYLVNEVARTHKNDPKAIKEIMKEFKLGS